MGDVCNEMHIVQSGTIEILNYLNENTKDVYEFTIEKLDRGCIINQNSFIMNDKIYTDGRCETDVTIFTMNHASLKILRSKHKELDSALEKQELFLLQNNKRELAIDYTTEYSFSHIHYQKHKKTNE